MKFFGGLFFTAFFFSIFLFSERFQVSKDDSPNQKRELSSTSVESSFDTLNFRRSYISLNEDQEINGLIYESGKVHDYMRRIFGTLIQKSHVLATKRLPYTDGNTEEFSYNTFLLLSLQVPMHESNLSHFRRMDPVEYCYFSNNVIDPIFPENFPLIDRAKKNRVSISNISKILKVDLTETTAEDVRKQYCKSSKFKDHLKKEIESEEFEKFLANCGDLNKQLTQMSNAKFLYDGIEAFDLATGAPNSFRHCTYHNNKEGVNQLFFSNDYADVGMMMINAPSHPQAFETKLIYDLDLVIEFGLDHLMKGFQKIANYNNDFNTSSFQEIKGLECFKGKETHIAENRLLLMKGAWSGKYNSGNLNDSCRFDRPGLKNKYVLNDENFDRSLAKVFFEYKDDKRLSGFFDKVVWRVGESIGPSLLHNYLPKNSLEYKAYRELINNVVSGVNSTKYLAKVLNTQYLREEDISVKDKPLELEDEGLVIESLYDDNDLIKKEVNQSTLEQEIVDSKTILSDSLQVELMVEELNDKKKEQTITAKEINEKDLLELKIELPLLKKDDFIYHTSGVDIRIRSAPNTSKSSLCANTRDFGNGTYSLFSERVVSSFHKVRFQKSLNDQLIDRCGGDGFFYIYKTLVEKTIIRKENIRNEGSLIGQNINIVRDRKLRNTWGMSKSFQVARISASDKKPVQILVTNEKAIKWKGKTYMWYEFLYKDGQKLWFSELDNNGESSIRFRREDE